MKPMKSATAAEAGALAEGVVVLPETVELAALEAAAAPDEAAAPADEAAAAPDEAAAAPDEAAAPADEAAAASEEAEAAASVAEAAALEAAASPVDEAAASLAAPDDSPPPVQICDWKPTAAVSWSGHCELMHEVAAVRKSWLVQ